jgi:hypothetical protein
MKSFNLIYEETCKTLIKEGGNAVPNVDRIKKGSINKTIKNFKNEVIIPFLGFDPGDSVFTIGSTGKKPDSGDIDLALDANILHKNTIITSLIKLNEICASLGYVSTINSFSFNMLHVAFPQAGNKNKFVQIDLLLTKYPDFTRFFMFSPTNKESNYKGAHRNELLHAIAKVISNRPIKKGEDGKLLKWSQIDINSDGLFVQHKTLIDSEGNMLKYKNTNENLEESYAKVYKSYPISHDPKYVIEMLVGKQYSMYDISSFEKLFKIIESDKKFKYGSSSEEILIETARMLKEKENRLEFPKELNEYLNN